MSRNDHIKENNWAVLESSDGKRVLGNITKTSSARIGRRKRKLGALLGAHWGDIFAVLPGDYLERVEETRNEQLPAEADMTTGRNNRFLEDRNANQKLEQKAIVELKEKGVYGEELVQAVVRNSSTFETKTPFSQEKYLKKKRAKFDLKVRVLRPTALTLCETYFERSPEKTLHLRADALAVVLGYSGARAGCRVLVYENCNGLITGALAERMDGKGKILNMFSGTTPPGMELVRMLNLSGEQNRVIVPTPIELLCSVEVEEEEDAYPIRYVSREETEGGSGGGGDGNGNAKMQTEHKPNARRAEAIAQRAKRGDVKAWIRNGCDCLIVATRYDAVQVFDHLLKYVAPSGSFVAYCTHLQDAADLQYALQLSKMAVRVELMEMTLISHQVLPGRSHPAMSDSATGGYIVSGMRIA